MKLPSEAVANGDSDASSAGDGIQTHQWCILMGTNGRPHLLPLITAQCAVSFRTAGRIDHQEVPWPKFGTKSPNENRGLSRFLYNSVQFSTQFCAFHMSFLFVAPVLAVVKRAVNVR